MGEWGRWRWRSKDERATRDASIREKYAMGWTVAELALRYDVSETRIRQIVYGKG